MYQSTSEYSLQGSTKTSHHFHGDKCSNDCEEKALTANRSQFKLPDIHGHNGIFVSGVPPDYRTDKTLYLKRQISNLNQRAVYGNCLAHGPESNLHEYCGDCDSHCEDCLGVAAEMHQSFLKDRNNFSRMFHERIPVCTCGLRQGASTTRKSEAAPHNNSIAAYKFIKKRNAACKKQPEDNDKMKVCCERANRTANDRYYLPSTRNKNKHYFPSKSRKIGQFARWSDWFLDK